MTNKNEIKLPILNELKKLNKPYNIEIDENDFNKVFMDSYKWAGYKVTGRSLHDFKDAFKGEKEFDNVYNAFPLEIKKLDNNILMIKEGNIIDEIHNNNLAPRENYDDDGYIEMIETVKEYLPNEIVNIPNPYTKLTNEIKHGDFRNDLIDFIVDVIKENTQLTINDELIYLFTIDDLDINFAKYYFETERYKQFQ